MQEMSGEFESEQLRLETLLNVVHEILPPAMSVTLPDGQSKTDATVQVPIGKKMCSLLNWEIENEMKGITSNPVAQNNMRFIQLQQVQGGNRSPMLLVTVVGCFYFQVFGAVWNGGVACIDPLCSPVSLLFVPRDPSNSVANLARVLSAIYSYYSR